MQKKSTGSTLKQNEILDAAISMFKEKGINGVSTRDLASVLGLSRSHIYHYFSNWDLLCQAALSRFYQEDLQKIKAKIKNKSPDKALVAIFEYFLPKTIDADWLLYTDLWQLGIRNKNYTNLMLTVNQDWTELIEKVVIKGIDSGLFQLVDSAMMSRQLNALINGYADLLEMNIAETERSQIWNDMMDFLRKTLYVIDDGIDSAKIATT